MPLTIGSRLGPYEVVALIGIGGMGEVYRARDTKLNRDVALKILPDSFAHDPDRVARFKREAQVLASLNHPNIAAIYGLEESDGIRALVLELVEGPTLAERLGLQPRAGLPLDEVLPIARQIVDALEAAHEKGVTHRDLKPANIKVRPDGTVKVLDFGLAKALDPVAQGLSSAAATNSPTLSLAATQQGAILGTAAYMSPEQAKGRPVDRRADIFAFGCVLYEMLTGHVAFEGDDVPEILGAVLKSEPDWTRVPANVPLRLQELLRLCLQKDVRKRRQAAGDVRIDLEQALVEPVATLPAAAPARGARLAWMASLAVAAVVIIALAIPAVRHLRETPPPEMRTEIVTPATTDPISFALSPDGRQLVFVASGDGPSRLWLRSLTATSAQPLAGTEGAQFPFWSPDSRSVAFFADTKLKRLDLGGGQPQVLADASARGGTWNADGDILFTRTSGGPIFRVSASGGAPVAVTTLDRQASHRFPFFLPDGRHFLFYAFGTPETTGIYLGSFDSPDAPLLTPADTAGAYYAPSGLLLWGREGVLVAQRLDLAGVLTGERMTIADSVDFRIGDSAAGLSVSSTGLIAYRQVATDVRRLRWFDRTGKELGTFAASDDSGLSSPRLSPDGARVAVFRTMQGNADIWLLDGTRMSRFTFDTALDRYPRWSPDGGRIVFDSTRTGGVRNLYVGSPTNAGGETLLLKTPHDKYANDWSADGKFLMYVDVDPQTGQDLWVLPTNGDNKPWPFLKTRFTEKMATFSPDGRWVAYESNESAGRFEIYVRPFVGTAAAATTDRADQHWQVSANGGIHPRWRPDGTELYFLGPDGRVLAASIVATTTAFEAGTPTALFLTRIYGGGVDNGQSRQYDVARDGRFLINTVLDDAAARITLLLNWKPKP